MDLVCITGLETQTSLQNLDKITGRTNARDLTLLMVFVGCDAVSLYFNCLIMKTEAPHSSKCRWMSFYKVWHPWRLCNRCVSLLIRCTPYLEDVPVLVHGVWQVSRRRFPAVSSWRTRVSAGTEAALGPTAATAALWSQGTRNPSTSTQHCPWSLQHVHVV